METNNKDDQEPERFEMKPRDLAYQLLVEHSKQVKPLVKSGMYETINKAIIEEIYKDSENHEFKTYKQWQKEEQQVKKGERGYPLWGAPKEVEKGLDKQEIQKEEKSEEERPYFPIAYTFSDRQVEPRIKDVEGIEVPIELPELDIHDMESLNSEIDTTLDDFYESIRGQENEPEISNDLER